MILINILLVLAIYLGIGFIFVSLAIRYLGLDHDEELIGALFIAWPFVVLFLPIIFIAEFPGTRLWKRWASFISKKKVDSGKR